MTRSDHSRENEEEHAPIARHARLVDQGAELQVVIENAPVGIGVTDREGRCLFLNDAGLRMHGCASMDELLDLLERYQEAFELRYTDGRLMPHDEWPLAKALRGELVHDYSVLLRRLPDGDERTITYSSMLLPTRSESTELLAFLMHDLTEQKRIEERLKRTLAQSEAIYNHMTEGLVIFDPDGNLVDMNPASLAIHGLDSVADLRRHLDTLTDFFEIRDLDDKLLPTEEWPIGRVLRGEIFDRYEVKVRRLDTGRSWIGSYGGTPVHDDQGRLLLAIVTLRDVTEQKKAEEQLMSTTRRLETTLTATEVGTWHWDIVGNTIIGDRNLVRLFDLDDEEMAATVDNYLEQIVEEDRERVRGAINQVLANGGPFEEEYRVRLGGGRIRWLHARGAVELDDEGEAVAFPGVAIDITARKRVERERDRFFELSLDMLGIASLRDESWKRVNPAFSSTLGWTRDELLRMQIFSLVHPDDVAMSRQMIVELNAGKPLAKFEHRMRCKDGSYRWIAWNTAPYRAEDLLYCVGRDTTQQREAEEKLRQSEATLNAVLDALPVGVVITDVNGAVIRDNEAHRKLWGMPPRTESIAQFDQWEGYWPESHQRIEVHEWAMARALLNGEVTVGELIECKRFDSGERRFLLNNAAPVRDSNGQIIAGVAAELDVTERRQAEQALEEAHEDLEKRVAERTIELERQNQKLRRLANQLTQAEHVERQRLGRNLHDGLQQLLVAAKMQLSLCRGDRTARSIEALGRLLDESISASRSLSYELSPPALHYSSLSEALEWLTRWFRENHHFQVQLRVDESLPNVPYHDKIFLFNAIRELLLNAVKHSGANTATVNLYCKTPDELRVDVSDQGHGFDAGKLVESLDAGGFGLFSIRERLQALGGDFTLDSKPGVGTTIILSLPLLQIEDQEEPTSEAVAATASESPLERHVRKDRTLRVVIADDHVIFREGLIALLERERDLVLVGEAKDGVEAIERADELRPHVILMDVDMPRMNGIEATRQIKQKHPWISIIGLSFHEEAALAEEMRAAGATAYLRKGGDAKELLKTMREVN